MSRYAKNTSVPIAKSRGEIQKLLRDWGCSRISWEDDYDEEEATLRFVWYRDEVPFPARFRLNLDPGEAMTKTQHDQFQRSSHRVLLIWIKAALNAVEAGLVSAEAVFLPWLEGYDGRTVAEVALPQIEKLLTMPANATLSLPPGGGE